MLRSSCLPFPKWHLFLCLESRWQRLDQHHVHLPTLGDGEHQLLHRWHHQPQLSSTEGGWPGRGWWAKQAHSDSLFMFTSHSDAAGVFFFQRLPVFSQSSLVPSTNTLLLQCLSCSMTIRLSARTRCVCDVTTHYLLGVWLLRAFVLR